MKLNRLVLTGSKELRPRQLKKRLTELIQSRQRKAGDWLNRKTKDWSKRQQQWLWGGWVGLGLSYSFVTCLQAFHRTPTPKNFGSGASTIVAVPQLIHQHQIEAYADTWDQIQAFRWKLDSLCRLDTGSLHQLMPQHTNPK